MTGKCPLQPVLVIFNNVFSLLSHRFHVDCMWITIGRWLFLMEAFAAHLSNFSLPYCVVLDRAFDYLFMNNLLILQLNTPIHLFRRY